MANKRRNKNKWMYWGGGVVFVALIVMVVLVCLKMNGAFNEKNEEVGGGGVSQVGSKDDNKGVGAKKKDEKAEDGEAVEKKEEIVQYEGDDPNMEEGLSGAMTYAGVSGGKFMIRVNINQYLEEGVCELNLRQGGSIIYSDEAEIISGPATATCQGFDVSTAEISGVSGEVSVEVKLKAGERTGVIRGEAEI